MKKNILLVNSFLILPLITPSFALCSENPKESCTVIVKTGTQLPLISQTSLKNSGSKRRIRKEKKKREQQALPVLQVTEPLIVKETTEEAVIDLPMPEKKTISDAQNTVVELSPPASTETITIEKVSIIPTEDVIKERMTKVFAAIQEITTKTTAEVSEQVQTVDLLAASIYQPTPAIKQGLGWSEWAKSKLSTTWFAIDAIKEKSFDPENADHMSSLNSAAEKLVLSADSTGLQDLLQACRINYPHIKLDKSVALQIQKRFQLDENRTKKEYADQIALENIKLRRAQEKIFTQNTLLIQNIAAQLESSNMELAKAQVAYMTATNSIIASHNKKLNDTHQGTQHLGKLYRKLDITKEFDSEYLNSLKAIHVNQENIYTHMETIDRVNAKITGTLSLLAPSEKPAALQLTDK